MWLTNLILMSEAVADFTGEFIIAGVKEIELSQRTQIWNLANEVISLLTI
jgi:hypothetical protein